MIRHIKLDDASQIADIYNYYIKNTIVSFEEDEVSDKEMEVRIKHIIATHTWLVYEENEKILGYAYSSEWNKRAAYRHTVETSVYLRKGASGMGLGTLLYQELLEIIKNKNYHTVIGGISLPNKGSVALHEKMGYVKTAHYKEVGKKFGKWIDVGYWQLILDSKNDL